MKKFKKVLFIVVYYLLNFTWGAIMSVIGLVATVFALIFLKCKAHRNGCTYTVEIGGDWGGLELGCFSFVGGYYNSDFEYFEHTRKHEFGHSLQNMILGPIAIFISFIPSIIRYWVFKYRDKKHIKNPPYDAIWFEGTATKYGTIVVDWLEKD